MLIGTLLNLTEQKLKI